MAIISFCIPTYNREELLAETLDSVIAQHGGACEIVVSDNASTDNTPKMMADYCERYPFIRYKRQEKNKGFDENVKATLQMATGDFCWMLGSDDIIPAGAITRCVNILAATDADLLLLGRTYCSISMLPLRADTWLDISDVRNIECSTQQQFNHYLGYVNSLGGLFSFMSSILFRRSLMLNVLAKNEKWPFGLAYYHVYVSLAMINSGAKFLYVAQTDLVLCRGDNESTIADQGEFRRMEIDYRGYLTLANGIFGKDSLTGREIMRIFRIQRPWSHIPRLRYFGGKAAFLSLSPTLREIGWSKTQIQLGIVASPLIKIWVVMRALKRKLRANALTRSD